MEEKIKNPRTLNFTREPGGKERTYTFEPEWIVYVKQKFYKKVKKHLCEIHFSKGNGMPDIVYTQLSMDDLTEIINSSPILETHYPKATIRIPLMSHRDDTPQEKAIDISAITGIQFVWTATSTAKTLMKFYIKDEEEKENILYTTLSGEEMDRAIQKASSAVN